MANSDKYNYLKQYTELECTIIGLTRDLEKWEAMRDSLGGGGAGDGMPHAHNVSSRVETVGVNIVSILDEISADIERAKNVREEVKKTVESVTNVRYRGLLQARFIGGMSVNDISMELGKKLSTLYTVFDNAIDSIVLPE